MPHDSAPADAQRLYFLDWIRICAFCVLVCFHTGLYYGPWAWHVKSAYAGPAIEPLLLLTSPWRMSLLFLVSGAASGFLLSKASDAKFLRERTSRLLVPLVFGMAVVVPPQSYCEAIEKMGYNGSYLDFLQRYLWADPGFCPGGDCLASPGWNHLWFVAYLWVYTVALSFTVAIAGRERLERAGRWLCGMLAGWRAVVLPATAIAVARAALFPRFGDTHALVDDWYNHAVYFPIFLLGALVAGQHRFWNEAARLRFAALALALGGWAALVCLHALPAEARDGPRFLLAMACVRGTCQWCTILAVCGFACRHLNIDGPARRYLTGAVFCIYIVHQTLIVVLATALKPLSIAPFTEAGVIVVLTFVGSFAMFEAIRRMAVLQPFFGVSPSRAAMAVRERATEARIAGR
ncbi:acyltransferase family protein [Massilia dura]|uniref:Acyltransferase family protein n=2 Tax=Pseudoduganella dura TaxID=321982 RepID=A0A6I3XFF9_9BURK|nr:acyltransferase family protein [Pseudoduganella dura]